MSLQKEKNINTEEFKYIPVDRTKRIECPYCGRLQMYGEVKAVEIKCERCGHIIRYRNLS